MQFGIFIYLFIYVNTSKYLHIALTNHRNTETEKQAVLATFTAAKGKYEDIMKQQASRVEKLPIGAVR